jgi:hypothetical protein
MTMPVIQPRHGLSDICKEKPEVLRFLQYLLAALAAIFLTTGCVGFVPSHLSAKSVLPGTIAEITPVSTSPRVGQVVLLRGLGGVWSYGIEDLGSKLNAAGVHATVFQYTQWYTIAWHIARVWPSAQHPEPLIIIGHSWGADFGIRLARVLNGKKIPVDLIVTFEPVTPPPVPGNVRLMVDYYQTRGVTDVIPFGRGVPCKKEPGSKGVLRNINLANERPDLKMRYMNHLNIDENQKIQQEIINQILQICPPRAH